MEACRRKKSAKGAKSIPSSSCSSCSISSLPTLLLMEILCRMSIKTLAISKSVCKSWLNLTKDPRFIKLHQRRSPTEICFQPSTDDGKGNTLELHLGNFDLPNNLDPRHFEIPKFSVGPHNVPNYNAVEGTFIFANSCNGLLCYYGDSDVNRFAVVWNPFTSEFITFPPPPSPCRGYGLGFSRREEKFKLLRLMGGSRYSDMVVADVCTIEKSCSWKRVGPCSSHAWFRDYQSKCEDRYAVFLNGTLHWVGRDSHGSCIAIHTFNFEYDHFGTLPLPHCYGETYISGELYEDRLGVFEGHLFVRDHTGGSLTIWLMEEYGVQGSWMKLFCLEATLHKVLTYYYCRPVAYMDKYNDDEILMASTYPSSTVFVYDTDLKSVRILGSGRVSLRMIAYKPSLLLLKDSMLGYAVHVVPNCAGLKQGQISTTPHWWAPMKDRWRPVKESLQQYGSMAPEIDDELPDVQVGEEREGHVNGMSSSSASEEPATRRGGRVRSVSGEWERRLRHLNKMSPPKVSLMLEMEKLKQRDKELEHRDKELKHRDRILDQQEKLLNILQELDNTDQSRMTSSELDRHLSKIKRYENLVARTFDQ